MHERRSVKRFARYCYVVFILCHLFLLVYVQTNTLLVFACFSYALVLIIRHLHIDFLLDPLSDVIEPRSLWLVSRPPTTVGVARLTPRAGLRRKRLPRFARKCSCCPDWLSAHSCLSS